MDPSATQTREDFDVSVDVQALKDAGPSPAFVGSIDQGTSSTRFLVFTKLGRIAASAQMEHKQIFPAGEDKVGWHEHDPLEIWSSTVTCINAVSSALKSGHSIDLSKTLKAVGITNQRETTIAWNAKTGIPYYNAIVWDDIRTTHLVKKISDGDVDKLRDKTGLPVATYFAGTKVKWLLDNVQELRDDLANLKTRDNVMFGTVDTWLIYQLTGSPTENSKSCNKGGLFLTDVTNASRWLFLNIHTMKWEGDLIDEVCEPHDLPVSALPEIRSSSEIYATCKATCGVACFDQVPITAILGDQQAALFGQCAFSAGEAKCTYGTGSFLMMNTGNKPVPSNHGLLSTVGYQIGPDSDIQYALEGSVSHSGSTIQWLRDQLGIIQSAPESQTWAEKTESNDGLYFVPAFAGLFAPHWRSDARGCIVGMTATHTRSHICRAALEAVAYQAREVFDAIYADSKVVLKALKVDGGMTANDLLMQFQADIIDADVVKPVVMETTSRGAALAAGLAVGVWKDLDELRALWAVKKIYKPSMSAKDRVRFWKGWQKAVQRSFGWVEEDEVGDKSEKHDYTIAAVLDKKDGDSDGSLDLRQYSKLMLGTSAACALIVGYLLGKGKK